jgi:hypothetical protein
MIRFFWFCARSRRGKNGFSPPFGSTGKRLSAADNFRRLDASFDELEERIRIRAYELYEQRGKGDGSAPADWLQAEAELTARDVLGVAA